MWQFWVKSSSCLHPPPLAVLEYWLSQTETYVEFDYLSLPLIYRSSEVYTCKSIEIDLKHWNYICKSEGTIGVKLIFHLIWFELWKFQMTYLDCSPNLYNDYRRKNTNQIFVCDYRKIKRNSYTIIIFHISYVNNIKMIKKMRFSYVNLVSLERTFRWPLCTGWYIHCHRKKVLK